MMRLRTPAALLVAAMVVLTVFAATPVVATEHAPVSVETDAATDVTNDSATLNGNLTGLDEDSADVWFEYWEADDPANVTVLDNETLTEPDTFDQSITGLENDTEYVYVAYATANGTEANGTEVTFTTANGADDGDGEGPPAVEDKHPFGQWIQTWLHDLLNGGDTVSPIGQMISEMVVANNPGADHRSDKANPGGNGNGPPAHAKGGDKQKGPKNGGGEADGEGDDGDAADALGIDVDGEVANGSTVTVTVTNASEPVVGANVSLNGEFVGATDENGQLDVTLPDPLGEEVVIEAEFEELEGEWEWESEA